MQLAITRLVPSSSSCVKRASIDLEILIESGVSQMDNGLNIMCPVLVSTDYMSNNFIMVMILHI